MYIYHRRVTWWGDIINFLQQFQARREHKSHSHAYVLNKDIIQIKQKEYKYKKKTTTNINNTACQSSDSGVKLDVSNFKRLYTSVLVPINELCLVLNSNQIKQIWVKSVHLSTFSLISWWRFKSAFILHIDIFLYIFINYRDMIWYEFSQCITNDKPSGKLSIENHLNHVCILNSFNEVFNIMDIAPKLIKIVKKKIKKWFVKLLLLQFLSIYPGLHPLSQFPVCLLHGELFRQWPVQLLTQLYPYIPSSHSVTVKYRYTLLNTSYGIII